jgi:hypothetical protein
MKPVLTLQFISELTDIQLLLYKALLRIANETTSLEEARRVALNAITEAVQDGH